jgi:hypothetical protein
MTSSSATMRAVRLSAPGPVDNLRLTTLPLPPERDGWVRIRVTTFTAVQQLQHERPDRILVVPTAGSRSPRALRQGRDRFDGAVQPGSFRGEDGEVARQ